MNKDWLVLGGYDWLGGIPDLGVDQVWDNGRVGGVEALENVRHRGNKR